MKLDSHAHTAMLWILIAVGTVALAAGAVIFLLGRDLPLD